MLIRYGKDKNGKTVKKAVIYTKSEHNIPKSRIDKIHDVLENYQYSSQIVMDLTSLGFTSQNALSIVNKYKTARSITKTTCLIVAASS